MQKTPDFTPISLAITPEDFMTDEQLIQGLRDKHPTAYHAVFTKYYGQLTLFAYSLLNDVADAEDVVSNAFMKLWLHNKSFESLQHVKSFLYNIIKNSCLDVIDKKKYRTEIVNNVVRPITWTESEIDKKYMRSEIIEKLYLRINKLPERTRRVFVLTHLEGYSRAEVATILGISENTVRNMLASAMNTLKLALNSEKAIVIIFLAIILLAAL